MKKTKPKNNTIWTKAQEYGIQQLQSEFFKLLDNIKHGSKGIDIGCYTGGTTISFSMKCSKLASIDIKKLFDTNEVEENCEHKFFIGNSRTPEIISAVNEFYKDDLVDFVFIDGDHSEKGAYEDYVNYKHLVKKGGFMFFHDIVDSPYHREHKCMVSQAWNRIKENHTFEEYLDSPSQNWAGIGMVVI